MRQQYETLVMEVIAFDREDVITESESEWEPETPLSPLMLENM